MSYKVVIDPNILNHVNKNNQSFISSLLDVVVLQTYTDIFLWFALKGLYILHQMCVLPSGGTSIFFWGGGKTLKKSSVFTTLYGKMLIFLDFTFHSKSGGKPFFGGKQMALPPSPPPGTATSTALLHDRQW